MMRENQGLQNDLNTWLRNIKGNVIRAHRQSSQVYRTLTGLRYPSESVGVQPQPLETGVAGELQIIYDFIAQTTAVLDAVQGNINSDVNWEDVEDGFEYPDHKFTACVSSAFN